MGGLWIVRVALDRRPALAGWSIAGGVGWVDPICQGERSPPGPTAARPYGRPTRAPNYCASWFAIAAMSSIPPSTTSEWPVVYRAPGLAR